VSLGARGLVTVVLLAGCGAAVQHDRIAAAGPGAPGPGPSDAALPPLGPPPSGAHLPSGVRPTRYVVVLDLRPARERFTGRVAIDVELERPTPVLWLHGVGLHVTSAEVAPASGAAVPARWAPVGDEGLVALRLPRSVGPGRATVKIAWDAAFAPRPGGLFRRRVGSGWAAFSRFEATWARHALPCFDEPGLAASFEVTLVVPREDVAVANGRAAGEEPAGEAAKRIRFAPTPPLPPHALRWAVGPLDVIEPPPIPAGAFPRQPIVLRGVTVRGGAADLEVPLAHAARGVEALERVLGGAAPLDAIDLVAVPGVDEETLLEVSPDGARAVLRAVASIWASRLVRPSWWDDLWLREALALWMEERLVETLHPTLGAEIEEVRRAAWIMGAEALPGARRLRAPVESPADIAAAFDPAAWAKAALVLAMIEGWIGEDAFRRVLRERGAAGRAVTAADLLAAWSAGSGQDVTGAVAAFVDRAGVPVVQVQRACEAGRLSLSLRQSRWLPIGSTLRPERTTKAPVCVTVGEASAPGGRRACTLLDGAEGTLPIEGASCGAWVMPNAGATGLYRWALPIADERLLVTAAWPSLSARERVAVATNLAAALHAGTLPAADILSLLPALARARERAVVEMPMALLSSLADGVADDATRPRLHAMTRRLYAPLWARLGWQPAPAARSDPDAVALRGEIARTLALDAEDPALRTAAASRGRAAVAGGVWHADAVPPELRDVALAVAAEVGDRAFFERLLAVHGATQDPALRRGILAALGRVRDPALSRRALDLSLGDALPVAEAPVAFAAQMRRRESRDAAWAWLRDRWDELFARVGPTWIFAWTAELGAFCDEDRAAEVAAFLGPRLAAAPAGPEAVEETTLAIRRCAALADAQRESAARFFRGGR